MRFQGLAIVLLAVASCNTPDGCELDGEPVHLPADVREASGVALSRTHDDVLWTHNDSDGGAAVYAVDTRGSLIATVAVPHAQNRDWEDIAVAPCPLGGPEGDCIYIGDIGDNRAARDDGVGLWVITEPDPRNPDGAPRETGFVRIRYPDSPRDAEAFVVTNDRDLVLVTKGREHPVTIYRAPRLSWSPIGESESVVVLETVQHLTTEAVDLPAQVTGASLGRDGVTLAIRTYATLQFYALGDSARALLPEPIPLDSFAEPQGEGVALGQRGRVFLASEAGPQAIAPRLTRLRCGVP